MPDCPVCDADVSLTDDAVVGELMECPECGTKFEVTALDPAAVNEAPQTEEDWGE